MNAHAPLPRGDRYNKAAFWFTRLRDEECSVATRKAFDLWLEEDERNWLAFEAVCDAWEASEGLAHDPELVELRKEAIAASVKRKKWWRELLKVGAPAAAMIAVAVATFLMLRGPGVIDLYEPTLTVSNEAPVVAIQEALAPNPNHFKTAVGERTTHILADGSEVQLSTDTEMRVAYSDSLREIVLLRGQAFFDVAHEPARPFVVLAGDQRVTALGTAFEVRIDEVDVAVTLVEGKVAVADVLTGETVTRSSEPLRVVELTPGQRLVGKSKTPIAVTDEDIARVTSWRKGRLDFLNERLEDVVAEINRYSNRKAVLEGRGLADVRVSGNFKAGSVDNFTSALIGVYPMTAEFSDDDRYVIRWRE